MNPWGSVATTNLGIFVLKRLIMVVFTRQQLVDAQKEYFKRYVTNPEDFGDPNDPDNYSDEAAEGVIDYLLALIPDA
jgi:hypothetical protein